MRRSGARGPLDRRDLTVDVEKDLLFYDHRVGARTAVRPAICLASEGARPAPGPAGVCSLVRMPGHLHEDWQGDVTEACGHWQQAGEVPWGMRVCTPRHSPLDECGERSRPSLLEIRVMSNHAGQRQHVICRYTR
jgi:hypothetical protein